jgi:hypothetical protein
MSAAASTSRRKETTRTIRMSDEERALFDEFCAGQGLTASEALRRLARAAALLGPTFSGEARAEIVELSRQMRAIGNNLNQTVHHMNAGHIIQGDDLKRHLDAVNGAIGQLDALYRSLCVRAHSRAVDALSAAE